jgi:hypothetical protein
MNSFTKIYPIIFGFISFYQIFIFENDPIIFLVTSILCLSRFVYFQTVFIRTNLLSIILFLFIDFSLVNFSFFSYLTEVNIHENPYPFKVIFFLGSVLLLLHIMISLILKFFLGRTVNQEEYFNLISLFKINLISLFWATLYFICIYLNDILGIFALGSVSNIRLPFKLGAGIFYFQTIIGPFFFFIILDMYYQKKDIKKIVIISIIFIILNIYSSFIMLSKGNFLTVFLYLTFWMIYRNIINLKVMILFTIPLVFVLSIYDSISIYRNIYGDFDLSNFTQLASTYTRSNSTKKIIGKIYNRTFKDGGMIKKAIVYENGSLIFNNLSEVEKIGGPSKFHTFIIDEFPVNIRHSSGSSGFGGAFMIGGLILCIINIILFSFCANFFDSGSFGLLSKTSAGKTLFASFFVAILLGGFWQFLSKNLLELLIWPFLFYVHSLLTKHFSKDHNL